MRILLFSDIFSLDKGSVADFGIHWLIPKSTGRFFFDVHNILWGIGQFRIHTFSHRGGIFYMNFWSMRLVWRVHSDFTDLMQRRFTIHDKVLLSTKMGMIHEKGFNPIVYKAWLADNGLKIHTQEVIKNWVILTVLLWRAFVAAQDTQSIQCGIKIILKLPLIFHEIVSVLKFRDLLL